MEAFQHLKRSTDVLKPVACSDNTFLSEVAERGYSRAAFTCNVAVTSLPWNSTYDLVVAQFDIKDIFESTDRASA
jgi:hypothetical protein